MTCKAGQFKVAKLNNSSLWDQFCQKSPCENRARGNRKTLKRLKMLTKSNLRTLKLKSHEEYLIYRTYFVKQKT